MCEGLEQRLKNISLQNLEPPFNLQVIDIDNESVSEVVRNKFDLRVPIMAISLKGNNREIELPRVSPRCSEEELFRWMQKNINKIIGLI